MLANYTAGIYRPDDFFWSDALFSGVVRTHAVERTEGHVLRSGTGAEGAGMAVIVVVVVGVGGGLRRAARILRDEVSPVEGSLRDRRG